MSEPTAPAAPQDRARFFDLSLDMLCIASAEGYFLDLNPRWSQVLGWRIDELTSKPFVEFVHPDDIDATIAETMKLQAGQDTVAFENRYRCADGSYRRLRWNSTFHDGRYWAVARDITDQHAAHEALRQSEERFRRVFEAGPVGIVLLDAEHRFIEVNQAMCTLLGFEHDELIGHPFADVTHPDDTPADVEHAAAMAAGAIPSYQIEKRYIRKDGRTVWARKTAAPLTHGAAVALIEDISARKDAEDALAEANTKLESWVGELEVRNREITLINEMGDMLQSCRSPDEFNEVLSKFARRLFPAASGALGVISNSRTSVETVATWGEPTSRTIFAPDECWGLRRGRIHRVEDAALGMTCPHLVHEGGSVCIPMMAQGEALGLLTLSTERPSFIRSRGVSDDGLAIAVAEHISLALANFRLRESLRDQSIRDPLTGLYNRRYVDETLERELRRAERAKSEVALLALDLDHFKRVNDTFGHDAGDRLLREVGQIIRHSKRHADIAARMGGEEFLVILVDCGLEAAHKRAEALADSIRRAEVDIRGTKIGSVTASMGIAVYPTDGESSEGLIQRADAALYEAKRAGRDQVVVASELPPRA